MGSTLREVLEERQFKGMICQNHTDFLIEKVLALRSLLEEWRNTPYYSTYREYKLWADGFRERVDEGLEGL